VNSALLIVVASIAALTGCGRRDGADGTPDTASSPPSASFEPAPAAPAPAEPVPAEASPAQTTPAETTPVAPADQVESQREDVTPGAAACNAEPVQRLVGEIYTPELGEEARVTAGARVARALRPGQIVTMEFRADRLSFTLDEKGRISSVTCG
jgi:hypothetical protein